MKLSLNHRPAVLLALVFALALPFGASAADSAKAGKQDSRENGCYYEYYIQKVGQDFARQGEEVNYLFFVKNTGQCRLRRIDIADQLPRGTELVEAYPKPSWSDDHIVKWNDVTLERGEFIAFSLKVKAKDWDRGGSRVLTNTACAFTPFIGTRICGQVNTTIVHHPDAE